MKHATIHTFIVDVEQEIFRAQKKFPSANLSMVALMEEVGELAQAKLKERAGKTTAEDVYNEAIQVAAMAYRVACEPDSSFGVHYVEPDKK